MASEYKKSLNSDMSNLIDNKVFMFMQYQG